MDGWMYVWWEKRKEGGLDGWWVDRYKDRWEDGRLSDVGMEAAWCVRHKLCIRSLVL